MRSVVEDEAVSWYCKLVQFVYWIQMRSVVELKGTDWKCQESHVEMVWQRTFDVLVAAVS